MSAEIKIIVSDSRVLPEQRGLSGSMCANRSNRMRRSLILTDNVIDTNEESDVRSGL